MLLLINPRPNGLLSSCATYISSMVSRELKNLSSSSSITTLKQVLSWQNSTYQDSSILNSRWKTCAHKVTITAQIWQECKRRFYEQTLSPCLVDVDVELIASTYVVCIKLDQQRVQRNILSIFKSYLFCFLDLQRAGQWSRRFFVSHSKSSSRQDGAKELKPLSRLLNNSLA